LWSGGYNTWTDVDTLFKGLTIAMKKNPKIKFVSTGGEIPEQDIKTYPGFISMIENSDFKNNFVMNGWVPGEDVPNYYFEADLGINIDKNIYEVKLGSKNRILDWMRAGLAVISSDVCELTETIKEEKIGYTFRPGDAEDLASKLLYLSGNRKELNLTAKRGKEYGRKYFNFDTTTKRLQEWVDNLSFAPDRSMKKVIFFEKEEAIKNLESIVAGQEKMISERDLRLKELEGIVKKGFIYKFYNYFKIAGRKLRKK
jgi:glycosyltransferase involved in cell wall biosynthesis